MDYYRWLVVFITIQLVTAYGTLRLTVIDLENFSNAKAESIVSLVNDLDNPKAEAWRSHKANTVTIITEDELFRIQITARIIDELEISKKYFTVEKLPDVKVKDSYRRRRRDVEEFDLNAYNTLESVNEYLDDLAQSNPELVTTKVIGYSYQNRPIKILKINVNNGAVKPKIFFDGGQHAREWISPAVILYITNELIEGYKREDVNLKPLLERYEFHFLPILNPDGYAYTYAENGIRLWRKNMKNTTDGHCSGVDLNRNWDFHWSGRGGSTDKCSIVYQGESAFSELETLAAARYIMNNSGEWHSYFSVHSFGQLIMFPYSHTYIAGPNYEKHFNAGVKLAEGVESVNGRKYGVGPVGMILYEASGSSESWAYSIGIPYTYTIELPDHHSFVLPPEMIEPAAKEWIQGFIDYFTYIETVEPTLYNELVLNVTINLPTTTPAPIKSARDQLWDKSVNSANGIVFSMLNLALILFIFLEN